MKKANPAVIGAFVGAVVLVVIGVLTFGSGKVFEERNPFVMIFDESLTGLDVGSPLTLNGVVVGQVTDIRVEYDTDALSTRIPVFAEMIAGRIRQTGTGTGSNQLAALIEKGFRAQLVSQSLVTGQLAIELSFQPDTEVRLSGVDYGVPELPTVTSGLQQLKETLADLPIRDLVESGISLVNNLDQIVTSPEFDQIVGSMAAGLDNFEQVAVKVNARADPILFNIEEASAEAVLAIEDAREAIAQFREGADQLDRRIEGTLDELNEVLNEVEGELGPISQAIQDAAGSVETTFNDADTMVAQDSPTRRDLDKALKNIAAAAKSIKDLADELERNPEALLRGKR